VCLEWTKEVAVGRDDGTKTGMAQHIHGSVEAPFADGESRFSNIDAKAHREFVGFAVLASTTASKLVHPCIVCEGRVALS